MSVPDVTSPFADLFIWDLVVRFHGARPRLWQRPVRTLTEAVLRAMSRRVRFLSPATPTLALPPGQGVTGTG